MKQKAIIYCRVSSDKQVKEGHGLDSQERLCRNYIESRDYEVINVFRDGAESGGLFDRPAMKELIAYLDKHPTEKFIVVFDDLKRFARDLNVHLQLKAQLLSRGVKLECPNFRFEDSPEGRLIENVTAATAQYERESNRRGVIQKMKARLEGGYWCFRSPPKGLKYVKDPDHGKLLVRDEPYASIFKEAIEKYDRDILLYQQEVKEFIDEQYRLQGINREISLNGVFAILTELLYTGYIEYPKWKIPLQKGKHEGFITLDTYNNVKEKVSGKRNKPIRKDYSLDFPLRTFVDCSSCGKPYTGAWTKGSNPNRRFPYYWCRNKLCTDRYKMVRKVTLENAFEYLLTGVKLNPENARLIQTIMLKTWDEEKSNSLIIKMQKDKEKVELEEKITNLSTRVSVTKDLDLLNVYEAQLKELINKKKSLETKPKKPEYTPEQFQTASNLVFETLEKPVRAWKSPDYQNKVTIVRMYFPNNVVYDLKTGFQTVYVEPTINLINEFEPSKIPFVEMPGIEPGSGRAFSKTFR